MCHLLIIPFSGVGDIPHVGLSGVISATYYALRFKKAKIGYLIPPFWRIFSFGNQHAIARSFAILRLPAFLVIGFFVLKDVALYFMIEKDGGSGVAHSAHISGAILGIIMYFFLRPSYNPEDTDLVPYE